MIRMRIIHRNATLTLRLARLFAFAWLLKNVRFLRFFQLSRLDNEDSIRIQSFPR